jgi:hypothetical protein
LYAEHLFTLAGVTLRAEIWAGEKWRRNPLPGREVWVWGPLVFTLRVEIT